MTTFVAGNEMSRPIFNYPLPPSYYDNGCQRTIHAGNSYHLQDHIPLIMFIDPQQLDLPLPAGPLSPPMELFEFHGVSCSTPARPHMDEQTPASWSAASNRKQTAQVPFSPDQFQELCTPKRPRVDRSPSCNSSSSSSSSSSYKSCTVQQFQQYNSLSTPLTPPLSPTNTIHSTSPILYPPAPSAHYSPVSQPSISGPINECQTSQPHVTVTTDRKPAAERHFCHERECVDVDTGKSFRSFSRRADLQRHKQCVHEDRELLACPKRHCARRGDNGFTRHDHLVEHLRGYHGEKIPMKRRRSSKSTATRQAQIAKAAQVIEIIDES